MARDKNGQVRELGKRPMIHLAGDFGLCPEMWGRGRAGKASLNVIHILCLNLLLNGNLPSPPYLQKVDYHNSLTCYDD